MDTTVMLIEPSQLAVQGDNLTEGELHTFGQSEDDTWGNENDYQFTGQPAYGSDHLVNSIGHYQSRNRYPVKILVRW